MREHLHMPLLAVVLALTISCSGGGRTTQPTSGGSGRTEQSASKGSKRTTQPTSGGSGRTAQSAFEKTYTNPVIDADYSDPDVCRVGDDFYMTSSSFNCIPGLQILHSTDLVHWEIIGAALTQYPFEAARSDLKVGETTPVRWSAPEQPSGRVPHGEAVWAPAIRYHNGEFYIYCGDPDRGIFMVKTKDPRGTWEAPVWVVTAKGFIDPCPLWDEDGNAYLSHGCAGSRAEVKSVLFVAPMSPDGTHLTGASRIVYDGHKTQPTIEGTKFYKRGGWYYIFSPAGGVPTGWQVVLRSKDPYGPYEEKVVMAQGNSPVNGPHQGAWVDTPGGEHWFLHFQDKDAYGRVVHLQPMTWVDDWPVIGVDEDGDGVGEPVLEYRMPALKSSGATRPADSDEFDGNFLGLQWQWQGNPSPYWYYCDAAAGVLKLYSARQGETFRNLSDATNLLLQKFPASDFTATAKVAFVPNPQLKEKGETCGLIVAGLDYAALTLTDTKEGIILHKVSCKGATKGAAERVEASVPLPSNPLEEPYSNKYMSTTVAPVPPLPYVRAEAWLRVKVESVPRRGDVAAAICTFSYSLDGEDFLPLGEPFMAAPGQWIGAKVGLFCLRTATKNDSGWMEVDWFRVETEDK